MAKRFSAWLLTVIFLLSLAAPCVLMLSGPAGTISASEKRKLATFPEFAFSFSYLLDFPKNFEKYLQDNFGLRDRLVIAYNALFVKVFASSPRSDVILGRDNWLFLRTDRVLEDFMGLRLKTDTELARIKNTLESRQAWLAEKHIRYLFVPIPNKINVYPEKLPPSHQKAGGETAYDQLTRYLAAKAPDVNLVALLPIFREEKRNGQLYYKTDTHWNEYGAYIAYREIAKRLSAWFPDLAPLPLSRIELGTKAYQGDLSQILHLESWLTEATPSLQIKDICWGAGYTRVDGYRQANLPYQQFKAGEIDRAGCPGKKLKAVVIHDSFGAYLRNLLLQHFQEVFFVTHAHFEDLKPLIEKESPDVVIDLSVARYLDAALKPHIEMERRMAEQEFGRAAEVLLDFNPATGGGQRPLVLNARAEEGEGFVCSAATADPQLIFQLPAPEREGAFMVHISLQSPAGSKLQLFFQNEKGQGFVEERSVRLPLAKGLNELYVKIPALTVSGALRLDPIAARGTFALRRFTVKSTAPFSR